MCVGIEFWSGDPFGLGDITLTLCVSDGGGSTSREALADLVSFLVDETECENISLLVYC